MIISFKQCKSANHLVKAKDKNHDECEVGDGESRKEELP